jgi:hypothetical protein
VEFVATALCGWCSELTLQIWDTLEKFYIFRETQLGNQINDKLTVEANPIFEALIPNTNHRGQ